MPFNRIKFITYLDVTLVASCMTFYEVSIDETKTILILCGIRFSYSDVTREKNQHIAVFVIEELTAVLLL